MTAPTQQLPPVEDIASLPKRSQIAYAIRCAQRAEPLYASKDCDPLRARFVRACIETVSEYFTTGLFQDSSKSIAFNKHPDYSVAAAKSAVQASEDAYNEDNDPNYDIEEAEYDESTPAHRVESVACFSLLAVYDTHDPIEEARRCERIALAVAQADFKWLRENHDIRELADMGPLWQNECLETFANRLEEHESLLK